jgi:GAF domain-containing protein
MINQSALLDAYETFGQALLRPFEIGDVLYRLTDQVTEVLDIDGSAVCLANRGGALELVSATDHHVAAIDDAQVANGSGPLHLAYGDNVQVCVTDLDDDGRWPEFARLCRARGMRAVAALPMPVDERRIGALSLYRAEGHEWTEEEIQAGQGLANMASAYVLNHKALSESRTLAGQLTSALDSRIIVEQAKGLLAGRHDLTPNEAFGRLRRHARTTGHRLHEVCHQVVEGSLDL